MNYEKVRNFRCSIAKWSNRTDDTEMKKLPSVVVGDRGLVSLFETCVDNLASDATRNSRNAFTYTRELSFE